MPRFMIERDLPGAGKLSQAELEGIARKSCGVLGELGPSIQWVQSYVSDDRITCVYIAPDEKIIREHAKRGGFPATRVIQIRSTIDPVTGGA
jgi:hypothetical protein